jgi:FdhD protein
VDICLSTGIQIDQEKFKRNFYASSSCGICGKASIEAINRSIDKLDRSFIVDGSILCGLPDTMRLKQAIFSQTGSLHAAALFNHCGTLIRLREDVGRHNAVDKLVGSYAIDGNNVPQKSIMLVSGRTSFEIIQKAASVGIEIVAAVSGPSSLAVDLAKSLNMGLVGFLRPPTLNIYSGSELIIL